FFKYIDPFKNYRIYSWKFIKVNKSALTQKSPGPDGFSEFYKRTSDVIAGKLATLLNYTIEIAKLQKDKVLSGSRAPFSLLNVDMKILSETLFRRPETAALHIYTG
uniref:Uncharacterized protein n=1 Tax=Gopherus evgoodei TaxID=1825980 RepID=A0A8C4W4J7_9SAUR